ncbi:MAG TPA: flippase activity-associated protein Agl23 [Pyrinomonadaceae bacterium]
MANTVSTKSGASKKARARNAAAAEAKNPTRPVAVSTPNDIPENVWRLAAIAILVIAAVLRMYDLNLVPLHHDEGVNGNFLVRLVREGFYVYDPENYHGPTLYYFAALFPWIMRVLFGKSAQETWGLTTVSIRTIPALFGLGTIGLIFLLRRWLGTVATLTAALLLALSPGAVYLSRYFIHETQFVFFTLGIVVAALYFYEERNPFYLILLAASASLLFATKETAIISAGVLLIALVVTLAYVWLRRGKSPVPKTKGRKQAQQGFFVRTIEQFGGPIMLGVSVVLAAAVFVGLWLAFYSSFFTNAKGISDSFKTFQVWSRTGTVAHVHPFFTYVYWLVLREGPLLLLGALGALFAVLKPKNAVALFSALWAFGIIAAYSLIPYKTPWLMLNFVVPLALVAGFAVQTIYELDNRQLRLVGVFLLAALAVSAYQCIDLNFINYDNDDTRYVYVYAHTTRGMLELVKEVDRIARETDGDRTGITVVSPDYWPLPWYFRNYTRVGYYGRLAPATEPIIIASESQKAEADANYGEVYQQVISKEPGGSFDLRPGVKLLLYERRKGFTPAVPPVNPQP